MLRLARSCNARSHSSAAGCAMYGWQSNKMTWQKLLNAKRFYYLILHHLSCYADICLGKESSEWVHNTTFISSEWKILNRYVCAQNLFSISVSKYKDYVTKKIQCICVWSLSEWQQPKNKGDQSATLHIHMLTGKNMSHLYLTNLLVLCISSKMVCYWIKHVPVTFSFYLSCKARTAIRWFICIINLNTFGQDTGTNTGDFWRIQNLFSIYLNHTPTVWNEITLFSTLTDHAESGISLRALKQRQKKMHTQCKI